MTPTLISLPVTQVTIKNLKNEVSNLHQSKEEEIKSKSNHL